jgi:UPF0755 protein
LLLLIIAMPLTALLVFGGLAVANRLGGDGSKDYSGAGTGRVEVEVKPGDSTTAIGNTLAKAQVVASTSAFVSAAKKNPKAASIAPGFYAMRSHMSGEQALALMLSPSSIIQAKFTIPEGTSIKNVLPLIAAKTKISLADLQAAAAAVPALGLPDYAKGSLEGYLFPATYVVTPDMTAADVLQAMVNRFKESAAHVDLVAGAQALGYTPAQIVIIASIIERESASPADAPRVARVFYNRLKAGMPLGSEFTVNYAGGDLTSPYNTYTHTGFPPGPYDSPGEASLTAALHPATGDYRFFVTLPNNTTQFVNTEKEFNTLVASCKAQGGCK